MSLRRTAGPTVKIGSLFLPPDQVCLFVNEQLETLISFEISAGKINKLYFVRNPDKLQRARELLQSLRA